MTEAEVRAMLVAFANKVATKAADRVTESGIQLDTAMLYVSNIFEEAAAEIQAGT